MKHNADESVIRNGKWKLRLIAAVLAVALILSISANIFVGISIERGDERQAAENYLVDSNEYIDKTTLQRLQEKLLALQTLETLEDYYRLVETQIAEEKYDRALENIKVCIRMYPGGNDRLYEDLLMKQGCLMVMLSDYDGAISVLDQVTDLFPQSADACLVKAQVYAQQGKEDDLVRELKAYLDLTPQDSGMALLLQDFYFQQGDYENCLSLYETFLKDSDDAANRSQAAYLAGHACLQLENYEDALTLLQNAQEEAPELEALDYYIGICQMSLGLYPEATDSLTRSMENKTMVQLTAYSRAVCRLMLDAPQYREALEDLQLAVSYQGEDADEEIAGQAKALLEQLQQAQETL